jgi:O-antigen ligase
MLNYFKFLSATILVAMLINLLLIATSGGLFTYLVRASLLGANPIAVSRSLAVIAAMVTVIGIRREGWKRLTTLILLTLILLAIVSTGSRGPLASFFAGIILFMLMFESSVYKSRLVLVGGISIMIVYGLLFVLPESLTTRFMQITQGDVIVTAGGVERVSTIATRLNFWSISLKGWLSSPSNFFFGMGAGGFSSFFVWRDFRWYPHNIFFEVLLEQGFVGFMLLIMMVAVAVRYLLKARKVDMLSEHSSVWVAATLVIFFSAQVSGDINDNRILLMFLAIALSSIHLDRRFRESITA